MTLKNKVQKSLKSTLILLAPALFALPASGEWAEDTLVRQEQLEINNTFNKTTWVGAHNAYANEEWGYFDPNQTLKPRNLLKAGARQMEYDPRKDDTHDLRLCHGDCSFWGGEKTFAEGLDEIKIFVKANPNAVVFLKLEMKDNYAKTAQKLENNLGSYIFKPQSGQVSVSGCSGRHGLEPEYMTRAKVLAAGKNVVVFAGNGALEDCPESSDFKEWVHVGVEYQGSGWQKQLDKPGSASSAGSYYEQGRMTLVHDPNTFANINGGFDGQIFTPGNVDNYMRNGHNVFELFNFNGNNSFFNDVKAQHMVWSWANNEPSGGGDCAVVNNVVGLNYDDTHCNYNLRFACYDENGDDWRVTSGSGIWEDGFQKCVAEFGGDYKFAVPANPRQKNDLLDEIDLFQISTAVYLNYHDLSLEGVWQGNTSMKLSLSTSTEVGYSNKGTEYDYRYLIERGLYSDNLLEVTSVRLRGKTRVKGIELTYSDGSVVYQGDDDGDFTGSLNLGGSTQLTGARVCAGTNSGTDRLFYIELTASNGSSIEYGPEQGNCTNLSLSGDFLGIFGTYGDGHLKAIGFYTGSTQVFETTPGYEISGSYNSAKCIYKASSGWSNGIALQIRDCGTDATGDNEWIYESSTGYIRAANNQNMCIHKKNGNWDNGNPIHVWSCSAGSAANKSWNYDSASGRISARNNSSKCIHKKYANWNNGNPIHLWDCSAGSNANKSWNLD
ncbi:MAG: hypothetical protein AAGM22_27800 [Acidobacteriota bacterium]